MKSVFYCRGRTPFRLLDSELDEMIRAIGQPEQVFLNDEDGSGFQRALASAVQLRAQMAVFRIEHLARASHRAVRLRKLLDTHVELYVHTPWSLAGVPMRDVADYSETFLDAYFKERNWDSREGLAIRQATRHDVGRPYKCTCGHPPNPIHDAREGYGAEFGHEDGKRRCLEPGCLCQNYESKGKLIQEKANV